MASPGINFAYGQASKALDDQLHWIEALDTKAGIILAADGVIVGLVLTKDSFLIWAPPWLYVVAIGFLMASFVLALLSFATRGYDFGPDIQAVADQMVISDDVDLKEDSLPSVLNAVDVNEPKMDQKARFLSYSGILLLIGVLAVAGYSVYFQLSL